MKKESKNTSAEKPQKNQKSMSIKNVMLALHLNLTEHHETLSIDNEDSTPLEVNDIVDALKEVVKEKMSFDRSHNHMREKILKHFAYCSSSEKLLFDYPPFNFESLLDLCNEGVRQKPKSSRAYYYRAKAKEQSGDFPGAIADLDKAIALKPNQASLYKERGRLKEITNHLPEAIADYKKMMQHKSIGVLDLMRISSYKIEAHDYMGAIEDLNKAVELDPTKAMIYYARGGTKSLMNDSRGALDDFNKSIELDPTYDPIYYHRGCEKMQLSDFEGALDDFNAVLEKPHPYINTYFCMALAKMETDDLLGAIVDFKKGKTIKPNPESDYYRAELDFYTSDKYKTSIAGFEKYIMTDSDQAKKYLAHLVSIFKNIEPYLPDDYDKSILLN